MMDILLKMTIPTVTIRTIAAAIKICLNSCGIEFELAPNFKYLELGFGQVLQLMFTLPLLLGIWERILNSAQAHNAIKLGEFAGSNKCLRSIF